MKSRPPLTKMEMIERSLSCFHWGLLGLLPVIGIPMAIVSLVHYRRVKLGQGDRWNPAERYLFWGGICARFQLMVFLVAPVVVLIVGSIVHLF
jgi:hypothetical protein